MLRLQKSLWLEFGTKLMRFMSNSLTPAVLFPEMAGNFKEMIILLFQEQRKKNFADCWRPLKKHFGGTAERYFYSFCPAIISRYELNS